MIEFREITWENFARCLNLDVDEGQKHFVASNVYSLAQAYVATIEGETTVMPFAIYTDETLIGFIMMTYDQVHENGDGACYNIVRLMIDKQHQKKGYGKQAVLKAIDYIKEFPRGEAVAIYLSYEPENEAARNLYAHVGFEETGQVDEDGELIAKLGI